MSSTIRWTTPEMLQHSGHPRVEEAIDAASYILWSLSGRQYTGVKRVTEVYSTAEATSGSTKWERTAVYADRKVWNMSGECCCSGCGVFHRVKLRGSSVRRIISVYADGRLLDPSEYVLLDHATLGLLNESGCCVQCLMVTYLYGSIPPGGDYAANRLADELLASADGEDCALPKRVTSVSRQGVSWTLLDPQDFLKDRRTGIYEIDLMLAAVNPAKALLRPRVFSPDSSRAETWTQSPPPPSVVISDGDQAVIPDKISYWVVEDEALRKVVDDGGMPRTQIGPTIKRMEWLPVPHSDTAVFLALSGDETCGLRNGDDWGVFDDCDRVAAMGKIRIV